MSHIARQKPAVNARPGLRLRMRSLAIVCVVAVMGTAAEGRTPRQQEKPTLLAGAWTLNENPAAGESRREGRSDGREGGARGGRRGPGGFSGPIGGGFGGASGRGNREQVA